MSVFNRRTVSVFSVCVGLFAAACGGQNDNGADQGVDGGNPDMSHFGIEDLSTNELWPINVGDLPFGVDLTPSNVITGHVTSGGGNQSTPVAGATVALVGSGASTTTAQDGSFALAAAAGVDFVRASAATYETTEIGVVAPTAKSVQIDLVSGAQVTQVESALGITLDGSRGVVIVHLNNTNKVGGYGASLSAAHDPPFVFDSGGAPRLGAATLAGGDNSVVFPNTAAGTTTAATSAPAGKSCVLDQAITSWRVDPGVFTTIDFDCQ